MKGAFWFALPLGLLNLLVIASMFFQIGDGFLLDVYHAHIVRKIMAINGFVLYWVLVRAFVLKRIPATMLNLVLAFLVFIGAVLLVGA
jgi:hypothetical protein